MKVWNAQNAPHIHTASTAATELNPVPYKKFNQQPSSFQRCRKVQNNWTLPFRKELWVEVILEQQS